MSTDGEIGPSPAFRGDINFVTTRSLTVAARFSRGMVAETRVLPEDLATTWMKLSEAFAKSE